MITRAKNYYMTKRYGKRDLTYYVCST
ncbi:hypothetical protein [Enterococcus mundtii]